MTYAITGMALHSSPPNTAVPNIWGYINASDALATIEASGYFDDEPRLAVNDVVRVVGSDGTAWLRISAISPATTTVVDTNAVSSLLDGYIWVGNASNAATAVLLSGDATITNAGVMTLADTVLRKATVTITAAQFNGMYASPKLLVAAPGANKLIVLDKVQLLMTYGTAAYAAGGVAAVQYDSTANGAGVIASTTLAAATFQATVSTGWNFNAGVVAETFSTCVNKGLYLSNITGAFTTGDSNMAAHIWYKIISVV